MAPDQLRDLGQQIARDIASGMIAGMAAGAAEFRATMQDAQREAVARQQTSETDSLTALADRLEAEREQVRTALMSATGLKRVALERRLSQIDAAEAAMVQQITGETPAALPPDVEVIPAKRERNGRFRPVNGTH